MEPSGGVRALHGDGPAQAGQVDGRALDSEAAVDDRAAGIAELRLLAADAAQARPVQQEDDARLAGGHDLAVGEQRRAVEKSRSRALSDGHEDGAKYCFR